MKLKIKNLDLKNKMVCPGLFVTEIICQSIKCYRAYPHIYGIFLSSCSVGKKLYYQK